jgi:hypothetical protein
MGLNVNGGVDYDHLVQLNKDLLRNEAARMKWLTNVAGKDDRNGLQKGDYKSLHDINTEKTKILQDIAHSIEVIDAAT